MIQVVTGNLEAIPAFCSAQGLCLHVSDQVLSHPSGPASLPKALEDLLIVLPAACAPVTSPQVLADTSHREPHPVLTRDSHQQECGTFHYR